eukprot:TRINITY_DN13280_c0_g1_i1.p1 TRINITY_DN13280_c0_g1~~TRINITY_DN13280_c0_g1_i1.p1  ORF type:complete len:580 (-),score=112.51 TRINITY_DN13280_c0_g1_i1:54-1793(-)
MERSGSHPSSSSSRSEKASTSVPVRDCPISTVVVYTSCLAEVTRRLKATLSKGVNEIHLTGLVPGVNVDSFRVSAGSAAKSAVILEVQVSSESRPVGTVSGEAFAQYTKEIEEATDAKARLQEELVRLSKEQTWVQSFAGQFLMGPLSGGHASAPSQDFGNMINASMLSSVGTFLEFYQARLKVVDDRVAEVNKKITELTKKISLAEERRRGTGGSEKVTEAKILVECSDDNVESILQISYVVSGASWVASYDCRVDSSTKTLELTYYGAITNSTGEDWSSPEVLLSTAVPSIGGNAPNLTTKFARLESRHYSGVSSRARSSDALSNKMFQQAEFTNADFSGVSASSSAGGGRAGSSVPMGVLTTESRDAGTCTTFTVKRQTEIQSDGKPHKVTITVVKLEAKFTYTVAPLINPYAYLKASITNSTTTAPFLAGDMSVFMDGNFVAKSQMKATHPGESFAVFLGADDAVKVDSEPLVALNNTSGWVSKSNVRDVRHRTFVKNTKPFPIELTVFEQLPKSTDGRLKVKLIAPVITEQTTNIKITDANNIKWKFDGVETGKRVETVIEYRYEYPMDQVIVD